MFHEGFPLLIMCMVIICETSGPKEWRNNVSTITNVQESDHFLRHSSHRRRKFFQNGESIQFGKEEANYGINNTKSEADDNNSLPEKENERYWGRDNQQNRKLVSLDNPDSVKHESDENSIVTTKSGSDYHMNLTNSLQHQQPVDSSTTDMKQLSTNKFKFYDLEYDRINYKSMIEKDSSSATSIIRRKLFRISKRFSASTNHLPVTSNLTTNSTIAVNKKQQIKDSRTLPPDTEEDCNNFVSCVQPYVAYIAGSIMFLLVVYLIIVFGKCVCDDSY